MMNLSISDEVHWGSPTNVRVELTCGDREYKYQKVLIEIYDTLDNMMQSDIATTNNLGIAICSFEIDYPDITTYYAKASYTNGVHTLESKRTFKVVAK